MSEFNKAQLIDAFEAIGVAAAANGTHLELAVYGGSAMMLASNFRFSTEDVDIAEITKPWPEWLSEILSFIAARNNWSEDWLNDAVECHLSPIAQKAADHIEYGSFPKEGQAGLSILVPSAEYLLALKLKAMRTTDPVKGPQETDDIYSLMRVLKIETAEDAIRTLAKFFPNSAKDAAKQRSL
jgi:hypothetical protein